MVVLHLSCACSLMAERPHSKWGSSRFKSSRAHQLQKAPVAQSRAPRGLLRGDGGSRPSPGHHSYRSGLLFMASTVIIGACLSVLNVERKSQKTPLLGESKDSVSGVPNVGRAPEKHLRPGVRPIELATSRLRQNAEDRQRIRTGTTCALYLRPRRAWTVEKPT